MSTVQAIADFLEKFAPIRLAEDWDNVGLLVGDQAADAARVMTCLTITPAVVAEAAGERADLIVTHHPLPFRPLSRVTADSTPGRMLLGLIAAGVAVYSPHTAFDSAAAGINQRLAEGIGAVDVRPLVPAENDPDGLGSGRLGRLAAAGTLSEVAQRVKRFLKVDRLQAVGPPDRLLRTVAVACGSAGEFLTPAVESGCDLLLTGETNFHTCLEAEARGVALLLPGHYASERFAVECLADVLAGQFAGLRCWASRCETDPLCWM